MPDLCIERQIHARYSAEVHSFPLPHFSACTQSDTSTDKKQSYDLCGGERCSIIPQRYLYLINPSYTKLFQSLTLYQGGEGGGWGGHLDPHYLINTWLYKPQILQGIRDTLQGLRKHKVCKKYFAWLPWQLFDNMVLFANNCQNKHEKQVFFKCSQKPQIRRC